MRANARSEERLGELQLEIIATHRRVNVKSTVIRTATGLPSR
jgi:hypothetical protein